MKHGEREEGGGGGSNGGTGGTGGTTCFGTNSTACTNPALSATGGAGAGGPVRAVGGSGVGGDINLTGGTTQGGSASVAAGNYLSGTSGGDAPRGGGGGGGYYNVAGSGGNPYGGGGAGGGENGVEGAYLSGAGGGGGGYAQKLITSPSGTYYYTVGSGGAGGAAGAPPTGAASAGGNGGSGGITISIYTSGVSNGSVGSGLTGYLPFYNSAGTNLSATSTIFLSTTGNVGIGTTSPSSKLDVWGNFTVGTSSTPSFFVNAGTGNVGVGTTSPLALLHIFKSLNQTDIDNANQFINLENTQTDASGILTGIRFRATNATNAYQGFIGLSSTGSGVTRGSFIIASPNGSGNATEHLRINSGGNVGIGTPSPGGRLEVRYDSALNGGGIYNDTNADGIGRGAINFYRNGGLVGQISTTGGSTAYSNLSDRRLKENISTTTLGLSTLVQIAVSDFNFTRDPSKRMQGFIAQDLYGLYPDAVTTNGDNGVTPLNASSTPWAVDYGRLTPLLVQSIKDLNAKLDSLTSSGTFSVNTSSGFIGIGTSTPNYLLHAASSTLTGVIARFQNATGYCDINPTTTSLTCSSDERLKKNILSLDATSTFDKFIQLNPVTYNWIGETSTSTHAGFIAQQVETLFPDLVATDEQGMKSVSYTGFIPYIIESVKTLAAEVKELTLKVAAFANLVETNKVKSKSICLESNGAETCISKEKLDAILLLLGEAATNSEENITPPDTSTTTVEVATESEPTASSTPEVVPVEGAVETEVETETVVEPTTETTTP